LTMVAENELEDRFRELRRSLDAIPDVTEPPKNTLRILGHAKTERKWNTLLSYFLDPSQPHGFGSDLLEAFLDKIEQATEEDIGYIHREIEQVKVGTEVTSPQDNRPDIVIRVPKEWFVCIESKVESSEGRNQTHRYIEDTHLGREEKDEYPEGGEHYIFLSKATARNSRAEGFEDLYWSHVVDAFSEELQLSHGKYPERSVSQLNDFLSTVIEVTRMEEDDFTETQKEKVQLLDEYREDIDELLDAAESLRKRSKEEWPDLFLEQLDDDLWTDEWNFRDDYDKYGCIFRDGWYLDDENLDPTFDHKKTWGNTGFRLHFVHRISRTESFTRGKLTYRLLSPTSVDMRDEFYQSYNSSKWQDKLEPLLDEHNITNKGNKKIHMTKTYDVDQSRLPESYFETLAVAFEEHVPIAEVVDEIVAEAHENVKSSE
jgi:hypothetical protein